MSQQHGTTYRPWEPQRYRQEAQSPEAKLPEGDVVFFLLDTVPQLARRSFYAPDETDTRGAPPCDPAMLVGVLLYADGVGVFSSRTSALACARHLACRALVGQDRPDFRPISDCRTRPLEALKAVVVQVVRLAGERGWCTWATSRPMARQSRAMRRGTRRGVTGICRRQWSACGKP